MPQVHDEYAEPRDTPLKVSYVGALTEDGPPDPSLGTYLRIEDHGGSDALVSVNGWEADWEHDGSETALYVSPENLRAFAERCIKIAEQIEERE